MVALVKFSNTSDLVLDPKITRLLIPKTLFVKKIGRRCDHGGCIHRSLGVVGVELAGDGENGMLREHCGY